MPNITNKNCFGYSKKNGGSCTCLKDTVAQCHGCSFFKDKNDPVNNELMKPFLEWQAKSKWRQYIEGIQ